MSEQLAELKRQAREALETGASSQALAYADEALNLDPNDSTLHVFRGIALSNLKLVTDATEAFRRAIVLDTHSSYAYYNLAMHQYQLGELPEAKIMALEALKHAPEMESARNLLANIEAKQREVSAPPPIATPQPSLNVPPSLYVRPGYEQTHDTGGVPFVRNMGPVWGYVLLAIVIVYVVSSALYLQSIWPAIQEGFRQGSQNINEPSRIEQLAREAGPRLIVTQMISLLATVAGILWGVFDIANRRANWAWVATFICCFPFLLPVYLLANRR